MRLEQYVFGYARVELGTVISLHDNERRPVKKNLRSNGGIPYYGANGVQDYVSDYIFDGKFVLVGEDGSVVDKNGHPIINWCDGKMWAITCGDTIK